MAAVELRLEPVQDALVACDPGERCGVHWNSKGYRYSGFIKRLSLALALHNHQPAGNFEWVLEDTYERSYLPMVECLERHPQIRVALHYTGFLLDHLESRHADFIARVRALVARGQVEVMGGGYFEPILPAIPDRDKQSQAVRLRDAVERVFGVAPAGFWLAERVWEPSLAKPLAEAGYRYAILDDSHFQLVGVAGADLYRPHLTEEQGHRLVLLATPRAMRYSIPWHKVPAVIKELRALAAEEPRLAMMGDDGEKFGAWPTTHGLCWTEGWVDRFFSAVEANSEWLTTVLPGEYVAGNRAAGPLYIPASSYPEMLQWSGGFWRNFLVRYPEVNALHKKMLRTSEKVFTTFGGSPPEAALLPLLRGQANDAYWHGVFGGIYLPHLRRAAWSALLEAEQVADLEIHGDTGWQRPERVDMDADGAEEVLIEGSAQNAYFAPGSGGALVEWDVRAPGINLIDCVARREEPYHRRLKDAAAGVAVGTESIDARLRVKEPGLEKLLQYDRRRRVGLQALLAEPGSTALQATRGRSREIGAFGDGAFTAEVRALKSGHRVTMTRTETVLHGGRRHGIRMEKAVVVHRERATLDFRLTITLVSGDAFDALLLIEDNLSVIAGATDGGYRVDGSAVQPPLSPATFTAVRRVRAEQPVLGIACELTAGSTCGFWYLPVDSVNNSEAGFERVTQGACLTFALPIVLGPAPLTFRLRLAAAALARSP